MEGGHHMAATVLVHLHAEEEQNQELELVLTLHHLMAGHHVVDLIQIQYLATQGTVQVSINT